MHASPMSGSSRSPCLSSSWHLSTGGHLVASSAARGVADRLGHRVSHLREQEEGRDVALAWLVGANPRLGETVPVSAVRDLKRAEVIGAALAFIGGSAAV